MKPACFRLHRPTTEDEAVGLLGQYGDDAKVIAGGQSLVLFGRSSPATVLRHDLVVVGPPAVSEYERRWAGLKAHNRWFADLCADVPGRRAGIAQLMLNVPDDAVREIEWARNHDLVGGVIIPGEPGPLRGC